MTSVRARSRELAERLSSGTRVRLLWRQGSKRVWIEVQEPDRVLAILVPPERALDAFHHPYAYAGPTSPIFGRVDRRFVSTGSTRRERENREQ